jgi:hypothetical protein
MPPVAALLQAIAILLVALLAPRRMLARVRRLDRVGLILLARDLERMHQRGEPLRYPGESLATVAARLDLLVWISDDPIKALRHLGRRVRGPRRFIHHARVMPPTLTPPRLACAALGAGWAPARLRPTPDARPPSRPISDYRTSRLRVRRPWRWLALFSP